MAYDVEDKVVQMRFDNREFDPNIDASIKSLEKLEQSLKLANGTKGFENVEKSARNLNLNPALTAVESLKHGFSTMEVVAITAISNITNRAIAMGNKLIQAFAIQPLTSGFAEYSEQMNSTQVILSNLSYETLPSVTASLDELNEYADRTIYSFGQMTQAIGKFAAAGVELKPATAAIKGLSSAAATVGANNQQLFSAYYNLAQSMQLGYLQLIDWKSLENSTIGNKTMREAFIKTAQELGTFTEATTTAEAAYADFRGSLSDKWLTSDVIVKTLEKYSRAIKKNGDAYYDWNEATKSYGAALTKVKDEVTGVTYYMSDTYGRMEEWEVQLAETAYKSATEIKSFKQMWETLTEAAGTGWAETWKKIFGNLEQAKELWTSISEPIQHVIDTFNDLRNEAVEAWSYFGGFNDFRDSLVNFAESFKNVGDTILATIDKIFGRTKYVDMLTETYHDVSNLYLAFLKATRILKIFSEYILNVSGDIEETSDVLANLLKPLKTVGKVLGFIAKSMLAIIIMSVAIVRTIIFMIQNLAVVPELIKGTFGTEALDTFKNVLITILGFIVAIGATLFEIGSKIFSSLGNYIQPVGNLLFNLLGLLRDLGLAIFGIFTLIAEPIKELLSGLFGVDASMMHFGTIFEFIGNAILFVINGLNNFITIIRTVIRTIMAFLSGDESELAEIFGGDGNYIGVAFIQGLTNGLKNGGKTILKIGSFLANSLIKVINKILGIHSPSTEGESQGENYVLGFIKGIIDRIRSLIIIGKKMVDAFINSIAGEFNKDTKSMSYGNALVDKLNADAKKNKHINIKDFSEFNDQIERTNTDLTRTTQTVSSAETIADKAGKVFVRIGETIADIWTKVTDFVKGVSVAQIIIIAFAAAVVMLIVNIARTIGEAKEAIEGLGRVLKARAARIWAEAFDQISQALFNLAKAIALLVLVANFDPEGMKNAAITLGIFLVVITALVVIFSKLITVTGKLKALKNAGEAISAFGSAIAKVFGLMSIAVMVGALAFSIMMLTDSLSQLSQIPTKDLYKGVGALVILMAAMTAIIMILSKNTVQLTFGTLLIFAYSYALKLFTKALSNVGEGFGANIQKIVSMTFSEAFTLVALVVALTVLSAYLNKASLALSKVVLAMTLLAIGFGIMVTLMGIFESNPVAETFISVLSDWRLWFVIGTSACLMLIAVTVAFGKISSSLTKTLKDSKTNLNKLSTALFEFTGWFKNLALSLGIVILAVGGTAALISMSMDRFGVGQTIGSFAMALAALAGICTFLMLFQRSFIRQANQLQDLKNQASIFESIEQAMRTIVGSIIGLVITTMAVVAASMLFWNKYKDDPGKGIGVLATALVAVAIMAGIVAGLMTVIGRNFKGDNQAGKAIIQSFIPIIFLVGELVGALALFSLFPDVKSIIPGILAVSAIMAPVIGLLAVLSTVGKVTAKKTFEGDTEKLYQSSETLKSVFKILTLIFASVAVLMAEITGISVLMSKGLANANEIAVLTAGVFSLFAIVIPIIFALNAMADKAASASNPNNIIQTLNRVALILLVLGGISTTLVGAVTGLSYISTIGGFNANGVVAILLFIGLVVAGAVVAVTMMIKKLGGLTITADKVKMISLLFGVLSATGLAIAGSVAIMRGVPLETALAEIGVLTGAIAILGGLIFAFVNLNKLFNKFGSSDVSSRQILQLATIFSGFALVMMSISSSIAIVAKSMENTDITVIDKFAAFATKLMGMLSMFMIISTLLNKINGQAASGEDGVIGGIAKFFSGNGGLGDSINIGIMFTQIAVGLLILSGALFAISRIPSDKIDNVVSTMWGMTGALAALSISLLVISKFTGGDAAISIGVMCMMIATSLAMVAGALIILSQVPTDKVEQIVRTMWLIVGALAALSVLALVISKLNQYALLGAAVIAVMGAAMIAGAVAVNILAQSDLVSLADKLAYMRDVFTSSLEPSWQFIGMFAALVAILTLGGPGVLIAAAAMLALAVALNSLATTITSLTNLSNSLIKLSEALTSFKALLAPFGIFLALLTLFAPGVIIAALAINIILGSITVFIASLSLLATAITLLTDVLMPFVTTLRDIGYYIAQHYMSFVTLGLAIEGFGIACAVAAPGLLALAAALSIIIVSVGAAIGLIIGGVGLLLALATPLIAILVFGIILLKDSVIQLFDAILNRLPRVMAIVREMAPMNQALYALGIALASFGGGLIALGAGAILSAIGLLMFIGILKLLDSVLSSMNNLEAIKNTIVGLFKYMISNSESLSKLGEAWQALGVGLILIGLGVITTAIGIAALAGALALVHKLLGKFEVILARLIVLYNHGGQIAALGAVLLAVGLGLIIFGGGAFAAGLGLIVMAGAFALLNAIGFNKLISAFSRLLKLNENGAIVGFGFSLIPVGLGLIALGIGCGVASLGLALLAPALILVATAFVIFTGGLMIAAVAFTAFSNALIMLVSYVTGDELMSIGIGLMMIAAGIVALSGALLVLSIPIAILTILAALFMIVATVCTMLLVPAITAISLALIPCIAAITAFVQVVSLLAPDHLIMIGLGLLMLAAGFIALAVAGVVVSLFITPMQMLYVVLLQLSTIVPLISQAMTTFANAVLTSAILIANAVVIMATAIRQAVDIIIKAISDIIVFFNEGIMAAGDFINGFVDTIQNEGIFAIGKACVAAGAAAIEGFRSKEGIDSHSNSKKTISAAKDFIGGFVDTIRQDGSIAAACKDLGSRAVSSFTSGIANAFKGGALKEFGNKAKSFLSSKFPNIFGKDSALAKGWSTVKNIFSGNFDFSAITDKLGLGDLSDQISEATSGLGGLSNGLDGVGGSASNTKGTLEELTDTIRNQMQIFERFNDEDILNPKELIHNMESQLRGIRNWSNGINMLAGRGASAGLIQYLSEMGPQGYKYVESFLEMTSDQFAKANSLFSESLTLPEESANTLLNAYRTSGAEIIEAVSDGISSSGGGATGAFDDVMDDIQESSEETRNAIVDDAIKAGDLSIEEIRMAGKNAIWAYKDGLWSWFSSADYAKMTDDAKAALGEVWTGSEVMDRMKKTMRNVDTSKTVFDYKYIQDLAKEQGTFYIDGWGKALSAEQYISECMNKGGQLLPAVIHDEVKPEELGELLGKTADEWFTKAMMEGEGDIVKGIQVLFGDIEGDTIDDAAAVGESLSDSLWGSFMEKSQSNYQVASSELSDMVVQLNGITESVPDFAARINNSSKKLSLTDPSVISGINREFAQYAKQTGNNTVQGFVNAIESGKYKAYYATQILAEYGQKGLTSTLKIQSPSKVTYQDGMYLVQGLVNAINDYAYLVTNATDDLVQNPIDSLSDTINAISDIFTEDIDSEPTIRPVLDMSNIDANADYLDTLFSTQQATIAANAQVRYTHDDSIAKLKAAYADVINNANAQLVMAIQNSEQPVNVNVTLQGDASTFFSAMVDQTRQTVAAGANNPFLITNRNSVNAALV